MLTIFCFVISKMLDVNVVGLTKLNKKKKIENKNNFREKKKP